VTDATGLLHTPPPGGPETVIGRVHSIATLGTGVGPGVRFIIYLQGCPLRCPHCVDPECQGVAGGELCSVDALIDRIDKFASYMQISGGGITVAGAEPLAQADFVRALFRRCRERGIATALDTGGTGNPFVVRSILHLTDLVVFDVTNFARFRLTGEGTVPDRRFVRLLRESGLPVWLRLALVPGWNDDPDHIEGLADFAANLPQVERIEVVPFHRLNAIELRGRCPTAAVRDATPPGPPQIRALRNIFRSRGLRTA
jgi:pyruvate formate lyase activating enzyme